MRGESVALIPSCVECEAAWLQADEGRWRAYLGGDDLDEPAEVVFYYCPDCAEREFEPSPQLSRGSSSWKVKLTAPTRSWGKKRGGPSAAPYFARPSVSAAKASGLR